MAAVADRSVLNNIGNVTKKRVKYQDVSNRGIRCLRSRTLLAEAQKAAVKKVNRDNTSFTCIPTQTVENDSMDNVMEVDSDAEELETQVGTKPIEPLELRHKLQRLQSLDAIFTCSEYSAEIYGYLRESEMNFVIRDDLFREQKFVTSRMRGILIDWLTQVHFRFHLLVETLYLTVSIIDRYLQTELVTKEELQLLGLSAIFLASKFEETVPPQIKDFIVIADGIFSKQDIIYMESSILKVLNFRISIPLPIHFLRRISKVAGCDCREHTISKYIMELTLTDHSFVSWPPSLLAAATSYLSLRISRSCAFVWDEVYVQNTLYHEEDLIPFVRKLGKVLLGEGSPANRAVNEKYGSSKFFKVSRLSLKTSSVVFNLAK